MKIIYETTAMLTNTRSEKSVEAEIDNVRETLKGLPESLDAYLANQKIHMQWNGRIYVGNAHGMEFTTPGPKSRTINGRNF
jgi:hypothetical protein|tara:strand:- start:1648 stop:1890 length:243 start_codon:yes stop_codon:yes gene_type:complete